MWTFPRTSLANVHNKPSHSVDNLDNLTLRIHVNHQNESLL